MRVKFIQSITVTSNNWGSLLAYLIKEEWDKSFFSLDLDYEKESVEKLCRDISIQILQTPANYHEDYQTKFIEGFGTFYQVDDPWSPEQLTTWVWWSDDKEHIIVAVEEQDEDEVEEE